MTEEAGPWIGLEPYQPADVDRFFAREAMARVVSGSLFGSALSVLYGPTGAGKTSLLAAGVVPRLRTFEQDYGAVPLPVLFRDWQQDPLYHMKTRLLKAARAARNGEANAGDAALDPENTLLDLVTRLGETHNLQAMLILDQFEERYLYPDGGFSDEFVAAVRQGGHWGRFLVAMRADSLALLDSFKGTIPGILDNSLRVRRLTAADGAAVISRGVEWWNERHADTPASVAEELADEVLAAVRVHDVFRVGQKGEESAKAFEIEAGLLQLLLTRLWQKEAFRNSRDLTLQTWADVGKVEQVVDDHVNQLLGELSSQQQDNAVAVLDHLVTPSGTKYAMTAEDLEYRTEIEVHRIDALMAILSSPSVRLTHRLERVDRNGDRRVYHEVVHDILVPAVSRWRQRYLARVQWRAEQPEDLRRLDAGTDDLQRRLAGARQAIELPVPDVREQRMRVLEAIGAAATVADQARFVAPSLATKAADLVEAQASSDDLIVSTEAKRELLALDKKDAVSAGMHEKDYVRHGELRLGVLWPFVLFGLFYGSVFAGLMLYYPLFWVFVVDRDLDAGVIDPPFSMEGPGLLAVVSVFVLWGASYAWATFHWYRARDLARRYELLQDSRRLGATGLRAAIAVGWWSFVAALQAVMLPAFRHRRWYHWITIYPMNGVLMFGGADLVHVWTDSAVVANLFFVGAGALLAGIYLQMVPTRYSLLGYFGYSIPAARR